MKRKNITGRALFFGLVLCLSIAPRLFAENVILKSGRVINKPIVERGYDFIKIDFDETILKFYYYEIASIDGKSVDVSALPVELTAQPASPAVPAAPKTENTDSEPKNIEVTGKIIPVSVSLPEEQNVKNSEQSVKADVAGKSNGATNILLPATSLPVTENNEAKAEQNAPLAPESRPAVSAPEQESLKKEIASREDELAQLKAETAEKDKFIALLKDQNQAFAEKEKELASGTGRFSGEISRLSDELELLKKSLKEKEDELLQEKTLSLDKDKITASLKEQLSGFSSKEQELSTTIGRANSGMIGLAEELQSLKKSLKEKEAALEEVNRQAAEKDKALNSLQEQNAIAVDKGKTFNSSLAASDARAAELMKRIAADESDIKTKDAVLEEQARKSSQKDKIIADLNARYSGLSGKEKENADTIGGLNAQVAALSRDLEAFKKDLEAKGGQLSENEAKFIAKDKLIASLAEKNKVLSDSEKGLTGDISQLVAKFEKVSQEKETWKKTAGEKDAALASLNKDFSDLSAREKSLNAQLAKSNSDAEDLAKNLDSLKKELKPKDEAISELANKLKDKEALAASLQEKTAALAEKEKGLSVSLAQAGLSFSNLSQETDALKKELQAKNDDLRQEKEKSSGKDKLIASLTAQNEDVLKKQAPLEADYKHAGETILGLKKEIEALRNDLSATAARYKEEAGHSLEKDNTMEALKAQSAALIKKSDEYKAAGQDLSAKLADLSKQSEALKNELSVEKARSLDKDKLIASLKDENVRVLLQEKDLSLKLDQANVAAAGLEKSLQDKDALIKAKDAESPRKDNLIASLQKENNILTKRAEGLAVAMSQSKVEVSRLSQEAAVLKRELGVRGALLKEKDARIAQGESALSDLNTKFASLSREKNNLDEAAAKLNAEVNRLSADVAALKKDNEIKDKAIKEKDGQLNEKNNTLASLPGKDKLIETLKGQNSDLVRKGEELASGNDKLNSEISRLSKELSGLKEAIASKDSTLSQVAAASSGKDKTIASLKEQAAVIPQKDGVIAGLKEQLSSALKEKETLAADWQQRFNAVAAEKNSALFQAGAQGAEKEKAFASLKEQAATLTQKDGVIAGLKGQVASKEAAMADLDQRIKAALADKGDLVRKSEELAAGNDKLNSEISRLFKELSGLKEAIVSKDAALSQVAAASSGKDKTIAFLKEQAATLIQKDGVIAGLKGQVALKESALSDLNTKFASLSREKNNLDEAAAKLNAEVNRLSADVAALKKDNEIKDKAIKEKDGQLNEKNNTLASLPGKDKLIETLKGQNSDLVRKGEELASGNDKLNSEISRLSKELSGLKEAIASKDSTLSQVAAASSGKDKMIASLKEQAAVIPQKDGIIAGLKGQVASKEAVITDLKQRINAALADKDSLVLKFTESTKRAQELERSASSLQKDIAAREADIAKGKNLKEELSKADSEINRLNEELSAGRRELMAQSEQIQKLQDQFKEKDKLLASAVQNNEALTRKQKDSAAAVARYDNLLRELESVKKNLADKEAAYKEKQGQFMEKDSLAAELKMLNAGLVKKENDINRELAKANLEISHLRSEFTAANSEIKSKEAVLQRLNDRLQGRDAVTEMIKEQRASGDNQQLKNSGGKKTARDEALFLYEELGRLNRRLETIGSALKAKHSQSLKKDKTIADLKSEITRMIDEYNDEIVAKEQNMAQLKDRISVLSKSKRDLTDELNAITGEIGRLAVGPGKEKPGDSAQVAGGASGSLEQLRGIARSLEDKDKQIEYFKKVIEGIMTKTKTAFGNDSSR